MAQNPFEEVRVGHWIGGSLVGAGTQAPSFNPATDEVLGSFSDADESVAADAIVAANEAAQSTPWRSDRQARARALWDLADALEANLEQVATAVTLENGKPLREARFELSIAAPKLRYFAGLALVDHGSAVTMANGDTSMLLREPAGVAGIIVPWNSPTILAIRSLAPALAAGCTAAIKMPAQTALTNSLVASIFASVPSLPPGVVNMFTESGDAGAKLLVAHDDVDVVSYTGSTAVGARIASAAGAKLKRVSLELGGKTPMIVFDDADLDQVVPVLTAAVTTFAGQFCMTGSRVLAQAGIADALRDRLVRSLGSVRLGPGIDDSNDIGPLIDHASVRRVDAIVAGADDIALRGGPTEGPGAFFSPALLNVADLDSSLIQDEIFGPVATFEVFEDEDDAVRRANATQYGLSASIWTRDGARSLRVSQRIDAGTVWTNAWAQIFDQFEEGGYKRSGIGRLNGPGGLAEFQEVKHVFRTVS